MQEKLSERVILNLRPSEVAVLDRVAEEMGVERVDCARSIVRKAIRQNSEGGRDQ